jgi:hypothetical protein
MHEPVPTRRDGPTIEAAVRLLRAAFDMTNDGRAACAALLEAASGATGCLSDDVPPAALAALNEALTCASSILAFAGGPWDLMHPAGCA